MDSAFTKVLDDSTNFAEILTTLENKDAWAKIPILNYTPLQNLKDGQLVRFRGMIQDMQDPEIYLESYEVKTKNSEEPIRMKDGKYRDCLNLKPNEEVNYDSKKNVQGERRTLFVVTIPGINNWATKYEEQCNHSLGRDERIEETNESEIGGGCSKKRSASESMDVDAETPNDNVENSSAVQTTNDSNKRQCIDTKEPAANNTSVLSMEYLINSPIPDRPSKACMVKVYKDYDGYALNSIIDVVGFLSLDPSLDGSSSDAEMAENNFENINEIRAQNPPPSLIPRLHAIAVHSPEHHNPLLDERFVPTKPENAGAALEEPNEDLNMAAVRKDFHILLKLCLFNDDLAADYLLSHLISTVYGRSDFKSVGKFALNLCNLPKDMPQDYTEKLYGILELLLPSSHYLPLTLDTMNTTAFAPKKDYETNKLVSGVLQLAPHTHLILDETKMQEGKLDASGVQGIQHLAHLITEQQIKGNFQFYEIDFNANIPVLVLSEGRSMLPHDFLLPLNGDPDAVRIMEESMKAANHYLQQHGRLNQFRRYLTKAKTWEFTMESDEIDIVHNDFVEMRKTNEISTAEELHGLLVLSRLLAISRGCNGFDKESWHSAKQMESKRRERVQQMNKSNKKP